MVTYPEIPPHWLLLRIMGLSSLSEMGVEVAATSQGRRQDWSDLQCNVCFDVFVLVNVLSFIRLFGLFFFSFFFFLVGRFSAMAFSKLC